jgi:hypothetical protein
MMEQTPLLSAHVNGSSMTSTLLGTIGQTTEERLAGEDHAEIRYFTRFATSIQLISSSRLTEYASYDHHGESQICK